jgi:hypothetical protein
MFIYPGALRGGSTVQFFSGFPKKNQKRTEETKPTDKTRSRKKKKKKKTEIFADFFFVPCQNHELMLAVHI